MLQTIPKYSYIKITFFWNLIIVNKNTIRTEIMKKIYVYQQHLNIYQFYLKYDLQNNDLITFLPLWVLKELTDFNLN